MLAPKANAQYRVERIKKTIKSRPILESQLSKFEQDLDNMSWAEAFAGKNVNEQTSFFHSFLSTQLNKHFPEKSTTISNLDRK